MSKNTTQGPVTPVLRVILEQGKKRLVLLACGHRKLIPRTKTTVRCQKCRVERRAAAEAGR